MRSRATLLLVLCAVYAQARELWEYDKEFKKAKLGKSLTMTDGVYDLNEDNVEDAEKAFDTLLILFHNPENEVSEELLAGMRAATKVTTERSGGIAFCRFDTRYHGYLNHLAKAGSPMYVKKNLEKGHTILMVRNGELTNFQREWTLEGVLETLWRRLNSPICMSVETVEAAEKAAAAHPAIIMGWAVPKLPFAAAASATQFATDLGTAVQGYIELPCFVTSNQAVLAHYQVTEHPSISLLKQYDERNDMPAAIYQKGSNIQPWVEEHVRHDVQDFKRDMLGVWEAFKLSPRQNLVVLMADPAAADFEATLSAFTAASKANRAKGGKWLRLSYILLRMPEKGSDNDELAWSMFHLRRQDLPAVRIRGASSFQPDGGGGGEITEASLAKFSEGFMAGALPKMAKIRPSEKPPRTNNGPLFTAVGATFDDFLKVQGKGMDVVVTVVAAWCGHCQTFRPSLKKLAQDVAKVATNQVLFVVVDGDKNMLPDRDRALVDVFPTVLLYPAHGDRDDPEAPGPTKMPEQYGSKNAVSVKNFMKAECHLKFAMPDGDSGGMGLASGSGSGDTPGISDEEFDEL
jgi:thiol-disulfide isomerase/thioredoxin